MSYPVIFILVATIIIIVWILLLFRINILIEYKRNEWNDHLILSFYTFGGLLKYKFEIPLVDLEKSGIRFNKLKEKGKEEDDVLKEKGIMKFFELLERAGDMRNFYKVNKSMICKLKAYLRTRLVCKDFQLNMAIGTGDAGYTGVVNGIVWLLVGAVVSFIENNFTLQKRTLDVKADFNEKKFKIDLYCIFHIKIVHIIVMVISILLNVLRKKIGAKVNKSIGGGVCG